MIRPGRAALLNCADAQVPVEPLVSARAGRRPFSPARRRVAALGVLLATVAGVGASVAGAAPAGAA
jgi:hypothetical protein